MCSVIGLVNYYGKFNHNLATIIQPFNALLQADEMWNWTSQWAQAFLLVKHQLTSVKVHTHYDARLPIKLAAAASACGIEAVNFHAIPDGSERHIAFSLLVKVTMHRLRRTLYP